MSVLNQTVSETLANGRVGSPVFVRWTAAAAEDCEQLKPLLAEMTAYTGSWLSANPRRIYATGSADKGHLSLALEYENGESALLAITLAHDHPSVNLAILGARGAIFHTDFDISAHAKKAVGAAEKGSNHSALLAASKILAAIDKSLFAKQPVSLSPEGDQP